MICACLSHFCFWSSSVISSKTTDRLSWHTQTKENSTDKFYFPDTISGSLIILCLLCCQPDLESREEPYIFVSEFLYFPIFFSLVSLHPIFSYGKWLHNILSRSRIELPGIHFYCPSLWCLNWTSDTEDYLNLTSTFWASFSNLSACVNVPLQTNFVLCPIVYMRVPVIMSTYSSTLSSCCFAPSLWQEKWNEICNVWYVLFWSLICSILESSMFRPKLTRIQLCGMQNLLNINCYLTVIQKGGYFR